MRRTARRGTRYEALTTNKLFLVSSLYKTTKDVNITTYFINRING
jgi:hypothetical protein